MDIISYALAKSKMNDAVSSYLDEHLTNPTNPPIDDSLTIESAAADAKATGDAISSLNADITANINSVKSGLSEVESALYTQEIRTANGTAANWRLNDSGLSYYESGASIVRYNVTAGDLIKIVCEDLWQFQTTAYVPDSGEPTRVGDTHPAGTYIVTVPSNAPYLLVSVQPSGTQAVYSVESKLDSIDDKIDKDQGSENAGKILTVGSDGMVVPADSGGGADESQFSHISNLFIEQDAINATLNSNGTTGTQSGYKERTSDFIPVVPGEKYTAQIWATPPSDKTWCTGIYVVQYDSNKTRISYSDSIATSKDITYLKYTFTVDASCAFIRICGRMFDDGKLMLNGGQAAVSYGFSYQDIQYVLDASNSVEIKASDNKRALQSLNLFDHSTYIVGQLDPDGTTYVVNYNKTGTSDFIDVEEGETYTMQVWATPLGETDAYKLRFTTLCFDANKTPISSSYITTTATSVADTYFATTRTIPTGAKYIKICTRYLDDANTRMMVNKGSLAMGYIQSANDEEYNRKAILSSMSSVAYGLTSPLLRPAYPRVMMHRGFSSQAPENTIPAFTLAGQGGAWGIETDVYETTDGYFVLSHDNDVSRMTDGTGNITEMTYAQTQACTIDAGANIEQYPNLKMPLLSDYLKICRKYGCVAVVEIKTITNYANLVKIIKDYGMEGSVVILTYYNATQFTTIRSLIQCPVCLVCTGQESINTLLTVAQNNVDVWASVYSIYITQENIDACHAVGVPFAGWTYTTQAGCESAVEMGMDIITGEGFAKYVPA